MIVDVTVRPPWPSEPPRAAGPGGLVQIDGDVVRRALRIDGEIVLAEAAWRGDEVLLRAHAATEDAAREAIARLRFVLALDDDLEPFHRAHRSDPVLGRIIKARPKLRVLRKPEPFEALAWAIIEQLIDTQRAGDIAWTLTRRHGERHPHGPVVRADAGRARQRRRARGRRASPPRSRARSPASRARSRAARSTRPRAISGGWRRSPASASGRSPTSNLFGRGLYDVPLRQDVGMRNAYARLAGVRTGSVTEEEFAAVLERFRPWQGLAAMYLVAAGWRSGGRWSQSPHAYVAAEDRYDSMPYRRCGRSGIKLPAISLGLWNRFGDDTPIQNQRAIIRRAFDLGITHIDLANNYGPPLGSAEINFGRIMREDLRPYRDELIISTKAGYDMWPGPYGEWGSRKYLLASLDQSLGRMGLEYVDIFYSHRFDPDTPLEETIGALDTAVRQGKALYAGISSYSGERTEEAVEIARALGTPILIHQPSLLAAQPLDRARGARHLRRGGRRASSRSRRSARACSPTATSAASRRTRARPRTSSSRRTSSTRRTWPACGR